MILTAAMNEFSPKNMKSYICSHVFENTRPILLIVHNEEDWMFMCGDADHDPDDCHVVGIGHLIDRDPTINQCADLPNGFEVERLAIGTPWLRRQVSA